MWVMLRYSHDNTNVFSETVKGITSSEMMVVLAFLCAAAISEQIVGIIFLIVTIFEMYQLYLSNTNLTKM